MNGREKSLRKGQWPEKSRARKVKGRDLDVACKTKAKSPCEEAMAETLRVLHIFHSASWNGKGLSTFSRPCTFPTLVHIFQPSCQIEWEIVSISLMQDFHAEIGSVQNILPTIDYVTTRVQHALIEVQAVQVKGHCADT